MRPLRSSALAQAPIVDLGDNLTLYYAVWRSLTEAMGGGASNSQYGEKMFKPWKCLYCKNI
ncbi:MAG: hypothetical protein HC769_13315 [Cyanobacteria bacterium CRU_2_1]|nr:hypothetical protein [Cyanobacteria bacterium CRU_2_1]